MIINLYLTKSRSSQVCFFGGIIIFLTFYLKHFKHRFWLFTSLFLLLLILSFSELFKAQTDMFSYLGGNTDGSSIEMRFKQLQSSLFFFNQKPLLGNGLGFFREEILPERSVSYETDLAGMESYLFELLIEQGIIQIMLIFTFIFISFKYFYANRNRFHFYSALGTALLFNFWLNAFITGPYGKWIYHFILIGLVIKNMELLKYKSYHLKFRKNGKSLHFSSGL
jgi:hypothetical protein